MGPTWWCADYWLSGILPLGNRSMCEWAQNAPSCCRPTPVISFDPRNCLCSACFKRALRLPTGTASVLKRVLKLSPQVTLILGGAASGKSSYAEQICLNSRKSRIYLATSQVRDHEMRVKIDKHVVQRGDGWTTYEEELDLSPILDSLNQTQICLLDCVTMWLTNHLLAGNDLITAQDGLIAAISRCNTDLLVVSNEVGMGIVPDNALARQFREAQGRLNIALAAQADNVIQVVAGLPLVLKGTL